MGKVKFTSVTNVLKLNLKHCRLSDPEIHCCRQYLWKWPIHLFTHYQ